MTPLPAAAGSGVLLRMADNSVYGILRQRLSRRSGMVPT